MAEQFLSAIAQEFPEYIEYSNLLDLSEITWKRYGYSADTLTQMDRWQFEMLLIKLGY
jgi:hypothetical protein